MHLVVGLGNPGAEYAETRHNIGMMILEHLLGSSMGWKSKFKGEYMQATLKGEKAVFLRPMTYMNLSGESVRPCMDFFKISLKELIVIHDELDLPFGTIMFKKGGGYAGHNGLKSIGQHTGSADYLRMRIGIGRPKHGDVSNYVLSRFSGDEDITLSDYIKGCAEALEYFLANGFTKASEKYNKKSLV